MNKVYIIIPVFNRKEYTRECLSSLHKQSYSNIQIVVIDDGSTDGTEQMIEELFPKVNVFRGDGSLWWSKSTNVGVQFALEKGDDNDYILLLNNDLVVDENYLETLISASKKGNNSLIGSVSVDIYNPVQIHDGGFHINWWTAKHTPINANKELLNMQESIELQLVSTLSGRGTLVPTSVFKKIGIFDAHQFPQYFGDYEFAVRAKLNGYNLFVSYKSIVYSHVKQTGLGNSSQKRNFIKFFFNIKSPGNIFYRIRFATSCVKNPIQMICFLTFDLTRNFFHWLKSYII